jgi:hypothetical protein
MVLKGQFLERPSLIPVGPLVLEALSHRGEGRPPLLALPPPPEEGGSMDHVVTAEVVWAAAIAGFPTVRFNFRGVAGSQGARGGPEEQVEDAEGALHLLLENTGTTQACVAATGGSASTALELLRRHPGIAALALISPLRIGPEELARLSIPLAVVVAEHDLRLPRAALAAAVSGVGGRLAVVEHADQTFTRNLPQVGKAVVHLLRRLGGHTGT